MQCSYLRLVSRGCNRITGWLVVLQGGKKVLVSKNVNPQRTFSIENYCYPVMEVILVDYCSETGCLNLSDLERKELLVTLGQSILKTPTILD